MNMEIRKRKKSFWALLLTLVVVLSGMPITALAATYTNETQVPVEKVLYPDDVINCMDYWATIKYYQTDGSTLMMNKQTGDTTSHTVLKYSDMPEDKREYDVSAFKCWKITQRQVSSGKIGVLKLVPVTYTQSTITYVLNGGTNNDANPATYYEGKQEITLNDAVPPNENYTFDGWYEHADFTGAKVTSIATTATGPKTLYAKFTPNVYNITYVLNGGTNATENPGTYTYGAGVAALGDAEKTGYTFEGWYDNATFTGAKVTSIAATDTVDKTLYAKFTPNVYDIDYVLNGGTNATGNPGTYTCGAGVAVILDASREGYNFDGWYDNATFTGTKVTGIATTESGNKTLYAKFSGKTYDITYELNGGSNAAENPATYTCGTGVATLGDASKAGYTFDGWYKDADFSTPVTSIPASEYGALKLYAKFSLSNTVETSTSQTTTQTTKSETATTQAAEQTAKSEAAATSTLATGETKTGDTSPIVLCLLLAMLSGAVVVGLRKNVISFKKEK